MSGLTPTVGGYSFLAGADPYSDGVVARDGFELVRARARRPRPWDAGIPEVVRFLASRDRSPHALCGIELRSPEALAFDGFASFNRTYVAVLEGLGLLVDGRNPVARTNVVPVVAPPGDVVLVGFSFAIESLSTAPTFVTAGAGELREDRLEQDAIVAPGDATPEGMTTKARHVMATMASRLDRLGVGWRDVTSATVYTARAPDVASSVVLPVLAGSVAGGIEWVASTPPVAGLDFEMDVRGVRRELVVELGDA